MSVDATGSPAAVTLTAVGVVLALLLGSFAAAPLRRPQGALAIVNLHRVREIAPAFKGGVWVVTDGGLTLAVSRRGPLQDTIGYYRARFDGITSGLERRYANTDSDEVLLYVESDNEPAVHVYAGLGFAHGDADTHVQYRRRPRG